MMKINTTIKAGRVLVNHNETWAQKQAKGLKVKTQIKADGQKMNHNETLGHAIQSKYQVVAENPTHGFRFHTRRPLTQILSYAEAWLNGIPERTIESFAETKPNYSPNRKIRQAA